MQQRIKNIRQHIVFKNLIGAFILCAFLLSITPKQVLHSVAADHKDQPAKKANDKKKVQFNEDGFNCDCNSIVATSPFTEATVKPAIPKLTHFSAYTESSSTALSSTALFYFKLRGPPAIV